MSTRGRSAWMPDPSAPGDRRLHLGHDRPAEGRAHLPRQPAVGGRALPRGVRRPAGRRGPVLPAAVPRRRASGVGHQRGGHRLRRQLRRGRRVLRPGPARRAADHLPRRAPGVGEDAQGVGPDPHERRLSAQAGHVPHVDASWRVARPRLRMQGRLGPAGRAEAALASATLFGPLREKLGLARVHTAISGPPPIAPQVLEFFWALGVGVREGYGQTENTAACTRPRLPTTCASAPSGGRCPASSCASRPTARSSRARPACSWAT